MILTLTRAEFTETSTIGQLQIADRVETFYVLEDVDRGLTQNTPISDILREKALHPGKTCIPYGTYTIAMTYSNRFKQFMPQLLSVPGFEGIRIHPGNTDVDSIGCLLPGQSKGVDRVNSSRKAYDIIYGLLKEACAREKVIIHIIK